MVKTTTLAALAAALLLTAPLRATSPYAAGPCDLDHPRALRAAREDAVRRVGEVARRLVETHGEMAVAALKQCTPEGGRKLCEWANTGALDKLGRPDDVLRAVAELDAGDDVALWLVENGESQLSDQDALAAFCDSPLDVSLGLQPLGKLAAAYRANRLAAESQAARAAVQPTTPQRQQQQQGGLRLLGNLRLPADFQLPSNLPDWAVPALIGLAVVALVCALKSWVGRGKESGSAPRM